MNTGTQDSRMQQSKGMDGGMRGSQAQQTGQQGKMDSGSGDGLMSHEEGTVAKMIERQTAKVPSDLFMWAAIGGMGVSALLELTGHKNKSRFFGQWVAPFLLFGVYNKLVKQHGSDKTEQTH